MQKYSIICGIYFGKSKGDFVIYKRLKKLKITIKFSPLSSFYQQTIKRPPLLNLSSNTPLSNSRKRIGLCIGFDFLGFERCGIGYT